MTISRRRVLELLGLGTLICAVPKGMTAMSINDQSTPLMHYIHPEHIIGDVHPFYHEGEWYVYYLAPGFYSRLMKSSNLLDWEQVPITHTPPDEGAELAPYFVLGVFRDDINEVFRTYHGWTHGNMHSHTSLNLLDWDFAPPTFRVLAQYQRYSSQRDPYVFWNEAEAQYWCVMTCKVEGYDDAVSGAVGFASSPDLQHWEGRGDLLFTETMYEPEVPQVFHIGEKWVLLASVHTGETVGKPSYWISDQPTGPWTSMNSLDGQNLAAANVGFDGERWLLMGWIPLTTPEAHGRYTWGGHLAFPREVFLLADGSLGTRLERGISAAIRGELLFNGRSGALSTVYGEWSFGEGISSLQSVGENIAELSGSYDWVDLEIDIRTNTDSEYAALRFANFIDVGLDIAHQRLIISRRNDTITPYADLPLELQDRYAMRVILEADMIEMFVNDRYSLCARLPADLGTTTIQLVASGDVNFERLEVYQLRTVDQMS